MNRIEAICSFINNKDNVIDIGCDQVEVGITLSKKNIKSIASDVSENVIKKAQEKIDKLKLNDYIDLRLSNGLDDINDKSIDTAVLAGMGTHTIIEILSKTNKRFKKIITVSNNYHDILRKKMNELNYIVSKELIIKENNKYYNLIVFEEGKKMYTEKELLLGLNNINDETYHGYLLFLKNKYLNIQKQSKYRNEKINTILKYIEETL